MNITFYCPGGLEEWNAHSVHKGLGGSESAVVYMAEELMYADNEVVVYNSTKEDLHLGSLGSQESYINIKKIKKLKNTDILIVWRSPEAILELKHLTAKKKYLWLHDMTEQSELLPFIHFYDKFMVLSEFHRSFYPDIPDEKFLVTRNGVTPTDIGEVERDPMQILYASNLDRGLLILLENWTKLKIGLPKLKLKVAYGWNTLEGLSKGHDSAMQAEFGVFKDYIERLFDQEGIEHLGRIGKKELHTEMARSQLLAYPCIYPETSCIVAMEAQAHGAVPVVIPSGALVETVKEGFMTEAETTQSKYIELLLHALTHPEEVEAKREKLKDYNASWELVAKDWLNEFSK